MMKAMMVPVASLALLTVSVVLRPVSASTSGLKCSTIKSAYVNLCGYCVGGSTGLQDSEGQDTCNICYGSNECTKCNDEAKEGCAAQSFPLKFDLAVHERSYKLYPQSSLLKENLENYACVVKPQDDSSVSERTEEELTNTLVLENVPYIEIDSKEMKIGHYVVKCYDNMSKEVVFNTTFEVVDSGSFTITSMSPEMVMLNVPFKAVFNGTFSSEKALICFTRINDLIENIVSARLLSDGLVECDPMIVHDKAVSVGISETLEAALDCLSKINMRKLVIHNSDLLIKKSTFSSDLRLIFIQFDQNINPSSDCMKAFSPETISLFGKGWQCWIRADQIVLQLGEDPIIHPGSRISLSPTNNIQQISSDIKDVQPSQVYTTIVDDVTDQVVEPVYNVLAPRVACYGIRHSSMQSLFYARKMKRDDTKEAMVDGNSVTVLEVQQLGGQTLLYNWSVSFSPSSNINALSQRDILMTWLSVRTLDRSVRGITSNRISLNNSLMLSNVDYTITVKGTNALGMSGEEKKIPLRLQDRKPFSGEHRARTSERIIDACTSGTPLDVVLSCSPATFSDVEYRVEALTSCCDGNLNSDILGQIGYAWSIKSYNGTQVNIGHHQRKYLNIPSGTFRGGERYKITCNLYHKTLNKPLGFASTSVVILERGIKTNINVSGVGISTLQPLILDASGSVDLDNKMGSLQFEWSCRMISSEPERVGYGDNQCYVPTQRKKLVQEAYAAAFRKAILHLPAGSLPVGRYSFSIKVSRTSQKSKPISNVMTIEVAILGGSAPLVYIPTRNPGNIENPYAHVINPDDGVTLTGIVLGTKAGCQIYWKGVDQPGYITTNKTLLRHEPLRAITTSEKPQEISAEILPGLVGDAKYRFRLSAICKSSAGKVELSYVDVDIITDAPPVVKPLSVEPLEGEALVTEYKFSTQPAYDDLLDYPLRYIFGFQILDESSTIPSPPKFFHSSSQKLSTTTYLPALSLATTKIQSLLRVCDIRHICHTVEGPVVSSNAPKQLTTGHVELLSEGFSTFLAAEEYEDAIMLVESSMTTLEVLDDKSLYKLASKRVENAVNTQLDSYEKRLDASPDEVNAALRFLKAANAALKHGSFSQETLQRLVAFKDKILSILNDQTKLSTEYQNNFRKRRQTQTDEEIPRNILQPEMVRTFLSVSEVAIFNLSDTEKALNEKRKLLQNVSFFMDSLCRGLRNSVPLFIGSKVVSFSVQRLNMQIKYKDDLAIPDWRSSKSGGVPVNATAQICLGEDVRFLLGGSMVCMGAAFYPMDLLTEVAQISMKSIKRHSSVYHVKIIPNASQKVTNPEDNDGLDVKRQTVRVTIPIWSEQIAGGLHLECRVWLHGTWDPKACKYTKIATLINKPAVECQCSFVGFYAVFAVESPTTTTSTTTTTTTTIRPTSTRSTPTSTEIQAVTRILTTPPTTKATTTPTQLPTTAIREETTSLTSGESVSHLPPGIPIPNTSQNFTFKIQEEFSATVGSNQDAFTSQLKQDILKQVEMPENMIASIDLAPAFS
ncbi:uncharacterized protein LOC117647012 isoform X2 [Thrips palmi]|uniref:Uncharacterized protein LOC117647012 isoform X2 n=1 Tax=Thrips palmi TaxID=161013 RepID=A0A6P8Z2Y0_THRPL|nr:uncharacterized protein LOC117647012 isoform X2 [Thrips palmi]